MAGLIEQFVERTEGGVTTVASEGDLSGGAAYDVAIVDGGQVPMLYIHDGASWQEAAVVDGSIVETLQGDQVCIASDQDSDLILNVGPYAFNPQIHDYAGLIQDGDWVKYPVSSNPRTRGSVFHSNNAGIYENDSKGVIADTVDNTLQTTGDVTVRILWSALDTPDLNSDRLIYSVETTGGSQADNISMAVWIIDRDRVRIEYQYGSNTNVHSTWINPIGFIGGHTYLIEAHRTSGGEMSVFVNGQKSFENHNLNNASVNTDGDVATGNSPADGGSGGYPHFHRADKTRTHAIKVYGTIKSDPVTYAEELLPNRPYLEDPTSARDMMNGESGTVETLYPASGDVLDGLQGVLGDSDWSSKGTTRQLVKDRWFWGGGGWSGPANQPAALQILGTMTLRMVLYRPRYTGNKEILDMSGSDSGANTHVLYRLGWNASGSTLQFDYRNEYTDGSTDQNNDLRWSWTSGPERQTSQVMLVTLERDDQGDGTAHLRMLVNGSEITPDSVQSGPASISGNNFVDAPRPDGGSDAELTLLRQGVDGDGGGLGGSLIHIKEDTTTAAREQELYDTLVKG